MAWRSSILQALAKKLSMLRFAWNLLQTKLLTFCKSCLRPLTSLASKVKVAKCSTLKLLVKLFDGSPIPHMAFEACILHESVGLDCLVLYSRTADVRVVTVKLYRKACDLHAPPNAGIGALDIHFRTKLRMWSTCAHRTCLVWV